MRNRKILAVRDTLGNSIRVELKKKDRVNDLIRLKIKNANGDMEIGLRQWEAAMIATGFHLAISELHSNRIEKKSK